MAIIGNLPYNFTNGTTADATQVMADLNTIINGVNNNAAAITSVQQDSYNYVADAGTVNNLIISMTPSPASYTDGMWGRTKAANTSTSTTVTVKFGSLGTKNVVIDQAGTLPTIGAIISGMHYIFEYDSTQDKCILINPSEVTGSFTVTQTGYASNPTTTFNYTILPDGNTVYFWLAATLTGTSNATTMTWTGIPAIIQPPTNQKNIALWVENNGTWLTGTLNPTNSSTWNLSAGIGGTPWTNTGTKAVAGGGYEYSYTIR